VVSEVATTPMDSTGSDQAMAGGSRGGTWRIVLAWVGTALSLPGTDSMHHVACPCLGHPAKDAAHKKCVWYSPAGQAWGVPCSGRSGSRSGCAVASTAAQGAIRQGGEVCGPWVALLRVACPQARGDRGQPVLPDRRSCPLAAAVAAGARAATTVVALLDPPPLHAMPSSQCGFGNCL
jgi:hypothetical protein